MTWKTLGTEIVLGVKDLVLDLIAGSSAQTGSHAWLDRSDHWQIDFAAEDAVCFDEPHTD